jgi:5-methylthioribose kinase
MTNDDVFLTLTESLREMGLADGDDRPRYTAITGGVSSDIWRVDLRSGSICVKRALPQLRVKNDWFAPVERNQSEIAWIREVAKFAPQVAPRLLGTDARRHLFAMEYLPPETHRLWRSELRDGRADPELSARIGSLIAQIHSATAGRRDVATQFATDAFFYALRLEPYVEATARVHTDLADRLISLARTTATSKYALVHGDVSPKNILIGPAGPVFLDAECAWYGDPAFDLAFCLNHLLLKCVWTPSAAAGFLASFDAMRDSYVAGVTWEPPAKVEARAAALLPALFLARIDGKSPVDYVADERDKSRVRRVSREFILAAPSRLAIVRHRWAQELKIA